MEDENPGGGGAAQSQGSATEILQPSDLVPTEWTNKKHSLYLGSMEASFIKQMHKLGDHDPEDLLGWVPHRSASRPISNHAIRSQFKVMCSGQWERTNFGMRNDTENQIHSLFENPWIKHFAPHIDDKPQQRSLACAEAYQTTSEVMHLASSIFQQNPPCHLQTYGQFPSRITEVSDQNFVQKTSQVVKLSKKTMTKRVRKAKFGVSILKDESSVSFNLIVHSICMYYFSSPRIIEIIYLLYR